MKELKLKHLAHYLPYGLKIKGGNPIRIDDLTPQRLGTIIEIDTKIKPILRPLSDLTKIIEYRTGTYCVMDLYYDIEQNERDLFELEGVIPQYWQSTIEMFKNWPTRIDWGFVKIMLEHHFDVFGLIDKGLAIDINTLDNEK